MKLPETVSVPLHPPEAVHAVAFAPLHDSVVAEPEETEAGEALKVSVGAAGGGADGELTVIETELTALTPLEAAHVSV